MNTSPLPCLHAFMIMASPIFKLLPNAITVCLPESLCTALPSCHFLPRWWSLPLAVLIFLPLLVPRVMKVRALSQSGKEFSFTPLCSLFLLCSLSGVKTFFFFRAVLVSQQNCEGDTEISYLPPAPLMHSLPCYEHLPPERHRCCNWWTYIKTA